MRRHSGMDAGIQRPRMAVFGLLQAMSDTKVLPPSSKRMTNSTHCFVSPHADDIAYSAIGSLSNTPEAAKKWLVTVFSVSCWSFEHALNPDAAVEVTAKRKQEDGGFATLFDCEYIALPLVDSSLRAYHGGGEYQVNPHDDPIYWQVKILLSDLIMQLPNDTVFYLPLGIGHHVDHLIVREAVKEIVNDLNRLVFYEDLPYADQFSDAQIEAVALSIDPRLSPMLIAMQEYWDTKAQAIQLYPSQLEANTYSRIHHYARRIGKEGYERVWVVKNKV
ncbi:MAG: PIG-L family deacetylase [Proteobacteria bacterium]|nr:PIG-L family deacetylase [Pseudomonadota bacterium]